MEREVSEVDRKLLLKKTYLDKINYHITRNPISQEELYPIVRHFFGEYLKLDYEFTYEELSQELNKVFIRPKVKEHIDTFLIKLSESEYLEENSLGSKEINAFLSELADIIMNVISEEQAAIKEDDSIIRKILKRKPAESKFVDLAGMNSMIDELNFHITSGNLDSSKRSYVDLLKTYDGMSKDDKKKLHEAMNDVYERLQTLMKNPKGAVLAQQQSSKSLGVSETAKKVLSMADETSFYIHASNVDSAKKMYADTLKLYESLSPDERKVLHPQLTELYSQLQLVASRTKAGHTSNISSTELPAVKSKSSKSDEKIDTRKSDDKIQLADSYPKFSETADSVDTSKIMNVGNDINVSGLPSMDSTAHSSQNITFIGDSGEALRREETNITPVGNSFDYSIAESSGSSGPFGSSGSTSSLVDEDIDAYRKPLIEDKPGESELDSMLSGGFDDALQYDTAGEVLGSNEIPEHMKIGTSENKLENKSGKKSKSKSDKLLSSLTTDDSTSSRPAVGNVLFNIGESLVQQKPQEAMATPTIASKDSAENKSTVESKSLKSSSESRNESSSRTGIAVFENVKTQTPGILAVPAQKSKLLDSLSHILKRINDDILMEKLDKAKELYKEALMLYRSMSDSEKASCYETFNTTFKSLDNALHQKSLHLLLESHLSESKSSQRAITSKKVVEATPYSPESDKISSGTTLPIIISADEETVRVYELIEESYFNMDKNNRDIAMLKYFKALELYRNLSPTDRKKSYRDLHDLFKRLSVMKNVVN